jgi:hypothetical protein
MQLSGQEHISLGIRSPDVRVAAPAPFPRHQFTDSVHTSYIGSFTSVDRWPLGVTPQQGYRLLQHSCPFLPMIQISIFSSTFWFLLSIMITAGGGRPAISHSF